MSRRKFRSISWVSVLGTCVLIPASVWAQAGEAPAQTPEAAAPSAPVDSEDANEEQNQKQRDGSEEGDSTAIDSDSEEAPSPRVGEDEERGVEGAAEPAPADESSAPRRDAEQEAGLIAIPASTDRGEGSLDAVEEEDEVVVLGSSLSRAAGSVQVLREAQLKRFEYDDPTAALVQVPGVYVRQEDGMGLRPNIGMRGANPDRSKKLTLMEDGILIGPAPYSAPAGYFFPLLTRMTQLRVIKGPGALAYGPQSVGGAIDFISRAIPLETSGGADVALGEYGYNKAHLHFGTSTEQFGFLVEGVRLQNTGFAELPSGADTGSTRNEWMVKSSYVLDPQAKTRHEFQLKLTYSDEVSNETYLGQTDADFRRNPYNRYPASALDQMISHRTGIVLSHVLDVTESALRLKTSVYRNDYTRAWKKLNRLGGSAVSTVLNNPTAPENVGYYGVLTGEIDSGSPSDYLYIGPNDRSFVSQGVQSVLEAKAKTGSFSHQIEAGLRLHNDEIRRKHTEDAFAMVEGQLVPVSTIGTLTTAHNRATSTALAAHITDAISWNSLTVTPGVRAEFIYSDTENFTNGAKADRFVTAFLPGVGAFYELLPGWGVLAGVYRGFSPPAPASDGFVSPEYSVNYEAGSRFVQGLLRAEVIGFYNDYSNMTDICTLSSGCITENLDRQFDAGAARVYGVEALVGHEVPLPAELKLPFSVAYTFTQGEFLNSFQSQDPIYGTVTAGDLMPYLPPHQANFTVGLEHRYAGINGTLNYVGRMRERASSGEFEEAWTTDEQTWFDLSAYGRPLPWLTIYANLRNVTGEAYIGGRRPYGARTNAPRWFQLGAKAEF